MQKSLAQIVQSIDGLFPKHLQKMIGIDGLGASGKSTMAEEIRKLHSESSIVHTDEFYKPLAERRRDAPSDDGVSPDFDWGRFDEQIIKPVRRNMLVKYERYDWRNDRWATTKDGPWYEVPPTHWIIIVGVYALQSRFFSVYDYTIWMDVPRDERIKRMIEREGAAVAAEWQSKWLPREEHYLAVERPDARASLTISANTSG